MKKEKEKRTADDEAVQELENKRKRLKTDVSALPSSAKEMYAVSQGKLARRSGKVREFTLLAPVGMLGK